jgi:hypothetical protein
MHAISAVADVPKVAGVSVLVDIQSVSTVSTVSCVPAISGFPNVVDVPYFVVRKPTVTELISLSQCENFCPDRSLFPFYLYSILNEF